MKKINKIEQIMTPLEFDSWKFKRINEGKWKGHNISYSQYLKRASADLEEIADGLLK